MSLSDVAAVVVSFNGQRHLHGCLESCFAAGLETVLVVDNYSHDASTSIAEKAGATVVRNSSNLGYGRAVNTGLESLPEHVRYAFILNQDATPHRDCVELLRAGIAGNLVAYPRLIDGDDDSNGHPIQFDLDTGWVQYRIDTPAQDLAATNFFHGACFMLDVAGFRERTSRWPVFDPKIFVYQEDLELSLYLQHIGAGVGFVRSAGCGHPGAVPRPMALHHCWRNYFYVLRRYGLLGRLSSYKPFLDIVLEAQRNYYTYQGWLTDFEIRRLQHTGIGIGALRALAAGRRYSIDRDEAPSQPAHEFERTLLIHS